MIKRFKAYRNAKDFAIAHERVMSREMMSQIH